MAQNRPPHIGATSSTAVWAATLTSAAIVAQLVAGKATRDALFLSHFDLALLPAAMIGAAVLSALSVLVVSRALRTMGPARVLPATFVASALLFGLAWALGVRDERAAAIAVYAHSAIINLSIGSAFWSLVNERFDPHTAKRLVGRIAGGGTAGGVVGGLLAWGASMYRSVPAMLGLLTMMSIVGLWSCVRFGKSGPTPPPSAAAATTSGARVFRQTPYLRDVALLVATAAATQALLDWLLNAHASHAYEGTDLINFFTAFNVAVSVLSFFAQVLITRVVLQKQGLGGAITSQSASVAVAVLASLLLPAFVPVVIARAVEQVARGSLYRSAYELFYTPLPSEKKRPTKLFIDVAIDRLGTTLAGGALFVVAHVGASLARDAQLELQTRLTLIGVLALNAAAVVIAFRLQRGYVAALATSLKSGAIALEDDDALDLTTRRTLAETSALLNRKDLLARIEEFQARTSERPDAVAEPSGTPADQVRALSLKLRDSAFDVRAEAARALGKLVDSAPLEREAVMDAVRAELATRPSSRRIAHIFVLLGLVLEREPLAIAQRALRAQDPVLRGTAFEYLEVVLPADIRDRLMPALGEVKQGKRRLRGQRELEGELLKSRG